VPPPRRHRRRSPIATASARRAPAHDSPHYGSSLFTSLALDSTRSDPIAQFLVRSLESDSRSGPSLIFERGGAHDPFYAPPTIYTLGLPPGPPPIVVTAAASGVEDHAIALSISVAAEQPGDTLAVTVHGVPTGATLSAGVDLGGGVWSLTRRSWAASRLRRRPTAPRRSP
jgi:hypothetical protein